MTELTDAWSNRDASRIRAIFADDVVLEDHRHAGLGRVEGIEAWAESTVALWELAPDLTSSGEFPMKHLGHLSRLRGILLLDRAAIRVEKQFHPYRENENDTDATEKSRFSASVRLGSLQCPSKESLLLLDNLPLARAAGCGSDILNVFIAEQEQWRERTAAARA